MISTSTDGHVRTIAFENPPFNHATVEVLGGIADALEAADAEPEVRAIVLASDGKQFCAGADLASGDEGFGGTGAAADPLREFYDQVIRLYAASKPIVAAVQGAAVGAGLGLAVMADFRVASPEARFTANFVKLGFHPGFALTHTLPRLIGAQRTAEMFLTAARYKPEEVAGWGLVDRIAPADGLRAAAQALAAEIAENAPLALLATRKSMRRGLVEDVTAALAREHAEQSVLKATDDYAEGVRAVGERRAGNFTGR